MTLRRQFDLLPQDRQFLEEYGLPWETLVDGSQWVLLHEFPTWEGNNHPKVTTAIRIETGYPNAELNMVYFYPALARLDGRPIGATQATQKSRWVGVSALVAAPYSAEPVEGRS